PAGSVTIDSRPAVVGLSISRRTSTPCGTCAAAVVVALAVASTAGVARAFGNQARPAPKLPTALINTIATSNDVDPSTGVAGGQDSVPGRSSAGAIDRSPHCGVHALPGQIFSHKPRCGINPHLLNS